MTVVLLVLGAVMRFFSRKIVLLSFLFSTLFLAACANVKAPEGTSTTVILLRHADRYQWEKKLNEKGEERAKALPGAVADLDIDVIYSPDKKRNLDTVKPLIAERNIELRVVDTSGVAQRMVEENPGKTVLWVGNTDNLETIYKQYGGDGPPPEIYGQIYVLTITDKGLAAKEERNFGGPGGL